MAKKAETVIDEIESLAERSARLFGTALSLVLHLIVMVAVLSLPFWTGIELNTVLLAFTTFLSIEAIVLAILNQNITNKLKK